MKSIAKKKKVKELITQFPFLVNNTNQLITYYWSHIENAKDFTDVCMCSSAESITRAFRHLVSNGEIVLSEQEKDRRGQHQEEFRLEYSPV